MEEDIRQLQKRFEELAARADGRGRYTYTQFLTLAEQDVLQKMSGRNSFFTASPPAVILTCRRSKTR